MAKPQADGAPVGQHTLPEKSEAGAKARTRIAAARTAMVLDHPFFGVLALRLRLREDPACSTAWVDGTTLGYNPEFVLRLSRTELIALVAHEVMHCAAGHPWRRGGRDPGRWNEACDRVVNPILREAGLTLPQGALFELSPAHLGRSAEWVYDRLPQEDAAEQQGGADKGDGPGPEAFGEVRDAAQGEGAETAEAWAQAATQAARAAEARGSLPAGLERFTDEAVAPRVDWRAALRRFVQEAARADYSWSRPNMRYLAHGLYLPALRSEEMGPVVVAVDTSGSIDAVTLRQFEAEVRAVAEEVQPRSVTVMYCDAAVHRIDSFARGEPVTLRPAGGGGTDFRPVFRALEDLEEAPACVLYLTDLQGRFPDQDPGVPTLWAVTGTRKVSAPFGDVICVS